MKLGEIYGKVAAGDLLDGEKAYVAIVALELLAKIEGVPVFALDLEAPTFALAYPEMFSDVAASWHGPANYRAWRGNILDAQMWAEPGDTDANPWKSLRRAHRLGMNKDLTAYQVTRHFPADMVPKDLSYRVAASVFDQLEEQDRLGFRSSWNSFLTVFDNPLALRTGLLPPKRPSRLPKERNHFLLSKMSPEIAKVRAGLRCKSEINALDFINRLAVASGILTGDADSVEDLRRALKCIPKPSDLNLPILSPKVFRQYVNIVCRCLGGRDYRLSNVERAWVDLRRLAREKGMQTSALYNLSIPAANEGILPTEVTASWAQVVIASHTNKSTPTQCRLACEQIDAMRGSLPSELLPPEALGIKRRKPRPEKKRPAKCPIAAAWDELYSNVRSNEILSTRLKNLWFLRAEAIKVSLEPAELTQEWLMALREEVPRNRLTPLYRGIELISDIEGFEHISPIWHKRQKHAGLPVELEAELDEFLAFLGAAPTTCRSIKLAVGILVDRCFLNEPVSLAQICKLDLKDVDLQCTDQQSSAHKDRVMQLKRYFALNWTPEWETLQRTAVDAGIGLKDNPIPKVLSWKPDPLPGSLKLEWGQALDRELRSTIAFPPYGRADLAKTLASHLAAFDRLHQIVEIAETGLLPEPLGPLR